MKRSISLFVFLLLSAIAIAQTVPKPKIIQLKNEPIGYSPADYYIIAVKDDRADTSNIGFVKTGLSDKKTILQIKGGTAAGLESYLKRNMKQQTSNTPVEVHISKLEVSEKRSNGVDKADIAMAYVFYVNGQQTLELSSNANVKSGLDATMYIEQLIRQQTESSLQQFGEWFSENKKGLLAAPSVKLEISYDTKAPDADYILYSPGRPLAYDDFKAKPDRLSLGAAATASSISMDASTLTKGREVTLKIKVAALFNQQHSWFKADAKKPEVLAHEQLHFDIAAYQACLLVSTIRNYTFSFENYIAELQDIRKQSDKNTRLMQDQYDEETNHGTIRDKQAQWEKHIKELMLQLECYR